MSLPVRFTLLYLSALAAVHAGDLGGVIQDPQSRGVPNAVITLYPRDGGAPSSTTSDSTGAYRLDALPAGDYILRAEAPGFAPFLDAAVHLGSDAAEKNVALEIAGARQQVVVTASGTSQTSDEVSKAVTVIDRADAEQRDAFSLTGVVDLAPGVRAQQLGGPGALATLHIRGMRNQDTAVLIDGLRLRDATVIQGDASALIEDVLFTNAGRVEVMNGAGSSLYGTNAIGGVVNILGDEGGGRTRGGILAEGGSLGMARARANIAGSALSDRVNYSLGLAHVNVTSGVGGDLPYRDTSAQGGVSFRLAPSATLRARLFAADAFGKINSNPTQIAPLAPTGIVNAVPGVTFLPGPDDPDSTRAQRFLSGAVVLDGQPAPRVAYRLSAQTLDSGRRYGDGPGGTGFQPPDNVRTVYDSRIQTVQAQVNDRIGAQLLTAGYEFEDEVYAFDYGEQLNPAAASRVHASERSNAVFGQDQATFWNGRLLLSGGFRAQFFQLDRPAFAPAPASPYQDVPLASPPAAYTGDGSAAYFLRSTGTKFRAHVGRGYRAPSLYERFGSSFDPVFGYANYGDPRLGPEHAFAADAGVDQSFAKGRARVSATYFYTRLEDNIAFSSSLPGDPFGRIFGGYLNSKGGLSRGAELSARFSPIQSLDVTAAYTFVNAAERTPIVGDVLRTFVVPRNQFSATVAERLGKRTLLTFDTLDAGNYLEPLAGDFITTFATRVYRFDGLRRVNAGASYRLPLSEYRAIRFYVRGENLGGQAYYESGFRTPGRTAIGGLQWEF
ncbi:MAG TPA: TonB-dependent receptor plug domain-containing protein [Bryobacteraceae bacterium]|nr:TonB-dependent receptor plug domain-containing protein [Bryobacteraceae bacterium]